MHHLTHITLPVLAVLFAACSGVQKEPASNRSNDTDTELTSETKRTASGRPRIDELGDPNIDVQRGAAIATDVTGAFLALPLKGIEAASEPVLVMAKDGKSKPSMEARIDLPIYERFWGYPSENLLVTVHFDKDCGIPVNFGFLPSDSPIVYTDAIGGNTKREVVIPCFGNYQVAYLPDDVLAAWKDKYIDTPQKANESAQIVYGKPVNRDPAPEQPAKESTFPEAPIAKATGNKTELSPKSVFESLICEAKLTPANPSIQPINYEIVSVEDLDFDFPYKGKLHVSCRYPDQPNQTQFADIGTVGPRLETGVSLLAYNQVLASAPNPDGSDSDRFYCHAGLGVVNQVVFDIASQTFKRCVVANGSAVLSVIAPELDSSAHSAVLARISDRDFAVSIAAGSVTRDNILAATGGKIKDANLRLGGAGQGFVSTSEATYSAEIGFEMRAGTINVATASALENLIASLGQYLKSDITINLTAASYQLSKPLRLAGLYGPGKLTIVGPSATRAALELANQESILTVADSSAAIALSNLEFDGGKNWTLFADRASLTLNNISVLAGEAENSAIRQIASRIVYRDLCVEQDGIWASLVTLRSVFERQGNLPSCAGAATSDGVIGETGLFSVVKP